MQTSKYPIIDSVSASDLLKALGALQSLGNIQEEEEEVSFSEDIQAGKEWFATSSNVVDFSKYMEEKVKPSKPAPQRTQRRAASPLTDSKHHSSSKLNSFKSRSHSPIPTKKPERKEALLRERQTNGKGKDREKDKENKKEAGSKKAESLYRASMQSQRILSKKESKYVPIHQRAGDVVRDRQVKVARLQKEQEIATMVKEKECTFKPKINHYHKKTVRHGPSQRSITEESERFV
jgi:hypothetical protein